MPPNRWIGEKCVKYKKSTKNYFFKKSIKKVFKKVSKKKYKKYKDVWFFYIDDDDL